MTALSRDLPLSLTERLHPARCVLLIVDMQNDFCALGGYLDVVMKKDVGAAAEILPRIQALIAAAGAAGVPVVWLRADYSHDRVPDSMVVKLASLGITAECCKPGTWGAEWYGGLEPAAGEAIVTKHSYSGFTGTDMQAVLAATGRQTIVFTGVQTQLCVESTLRDAHAHGWLCVVAEDSVGSHTPPAHVATLNNVRFLFGDVCASADIATAWEAQR